ncbi:MAG: rRNA pseudouridine synthase [Propionivibrio sp.]|nr:rRNA pseudouridine synthase [Propionivibrio sp.]
MTTTTRKTLGLPGQARAEASVAGTGRRPVRGGRPSIKRGAASELTISTSPPVKNQPQQKPRGTPSRAPVVPKSRLLALPPSAPAITTTPSKAPQSGVRISKLMAERGLCSRREADTYIERGWVFVNGERITELGTRADPSATIKLDKGARAAQLQQMTILLHKPVGYVSGQPEPGFKPAVTLVLPENQYCTADTPRFHASHLKGLAPAGRLDIDSTGLLVLTQDGRIARQLIGENTSVDKEYLVRVEGRLDARGLALLNHGLSLDDRKLKPARVEWLNEDQLRFVLNEGRKRQIRRMCELVGLRAVGLKRVRIGKVKLGDLPLGQWRFLRDDESF